MMELTALALGLPGDVFRDKIDKHITAIRLNYYPSRQRRRSRDSCAPAITPTHGLLTILNGENVPGGLQVKTRAGRLDRCRRRIRTPLSSISAIC